MNKQSTDVNELSPSMQMSKSILGFTEPAAIHVAARLGIADLVTKAPGTAEELATATKTHAPSLRRLLKFLASVGIFREDAAQRYQHTALSETLRSDHPESMRDFAIALGSDFCWRPYGALSETIRTGQPAFNHVFGTSFFEYLGTHPEDASAFDAAMTSLSSRDIAPILAAYDFSKFERIVDVGGGHGALLHAILSANPKLRGVLVDQPAVVEGAVALRSGVIAARSEIVGGDIFKSVPEGADAYVEKYIIHDWNDEDALKILKNCRRALDRGGKMLLLEAVLGAPNEPDATRFGDLLMLMLLQGRERTESQFTVLLREAGFVLTRVIPTAGGVSIIEGVPA
jgi:hypothetical protein